MVSVFYSGGDPAPEHPPTRNFGNFGVTGPLALLTVSDQDTALPGDGAMKAMAKIQFLRRAIHDTPSFANIRPIIPTDPAVQHDHMNETLMHVTALDYFLAPLSTASFCFCVICYLGHQ